MVVITAAMLSTAVIVISMTSATFMTILVSPIAAFLVS